MGLSELMMVIGWRFKCRHQELKKEGLESEGNISRVQWFKNGPVQISTLHCCPRLAYAHSVLTALGEVVLLAGQARVNFCFSLHLDQHYQAVCKLRILYSFIQEP